MSERKLPSVKNQGLTAKQLRFVEAYISNGGSGVDAYRVAYNATNMNGQSIGRAVHRLVRHARIAPIISKVAEQVVKDLSITPQRIMREYARIAFADIKDVATWREEGSALIPSEDLEADVSAAIMEVSSRTTTRTKGDEMFRTVELKTRMHNKIAALDMLAKVLRMIEPEGGAPEDIKVVVDGGLPADPAAAMAEDVPVPAPLAEG